LNRAVVGIAGSKEPRLSPGRRAPDANEGPVEVSIVIPCLNERETISGCVDEAKAAIEAAGVSGEILVADNDSADGSQTIAERAGARVVAVPGEGYGNALMGGIAAASGTYVLIGDADGSYDFRELPRFLAKLRAGADLVMGCRLLSGSGLPQRYRSARTRRTGASLSLRATDTAWLASRQRQQRETTAGSERAASTASFPAERRRGSGG
jgi:glycosyltransferase involved in cell wall biosynthesis